MYRQPPQPPAGGWPTPSQWQQPPLSSPRGMCQQSPGWQQPSQPGQGWQHGAWPAQNSGFPGGPPQGRARVVSISGACAGSWPAQGPGGQGYGAPPAWQSSQPSGAWPAGGQGAWQHQQQGYGAAPSPRLSMDANAMLGQLGGALGMLQNLDQRGRLGSDHNDPTKRLGAMFTGGEPPPVYYRKEDFRGADGALDYSTYAVPGKVKERTNSQWERMGQTAFAPTAVNSQMHSPRW